MTKSGAEPPVRARVTISGRVQGVGYRAFAARAATQRGLLGGVRNLDDGRVELDVEGGKMAIEGLLRQLKAGPPAGQVTTIETVWGAATGRYSGFDIWY
ncbi:MAG TPA: acylphosphatase [Nitrospira sp.]|nr:acylphosphatase [Nitrospira sp.]